MGNFTNSMVIFNSFLFVYQAGQVVLQSDPLDPKRRWDPDALDVDEIVEEMLLAEEAEAQKAGKTWINSWKFENGNGSMENMENMEMKWWWELCTNCQVWLPEIVKKSWGQVSKFYLDWGKPS